GATRHSSLARTRGGNRPANFSRSISQSGWAYEPTSEVGNSTLLISARSQIVVDFNLERWPSLIRRAHPLVCIPNCLPELPSSSGMLTNCLISLVLPEWIEHSTSPLPRGCSTTELRQHERSQRK